MEFSRPGRSSRRGSAFARSTPFMEQGPFYNAINFDYTYSDGTNTTVTYTPLAFLYSPSDLGDHLGRRLSWRHG